MTCNKPPDCDALHGTCRGSVEPLSEGGSPRNKPTHREQLRNELTSKDVGQGDLVFSWCLFREQYIPYQFEAHLVSRLGHIGHLCVVTNLNDGRTQRKKLRDLFVACDHETTGKRKLVDTFPTGF